MVYVVDTSSFIVMGHFFPERFPSFWAHLNKLADESGLISVREVRKELDNQSTREHLAKWVDERKEIFYGPEPAEMAFVAGIFQIVQFQSLVKKKAILEGSPVADPWVIAAAAVRSGCVVTEESERPNSIRIPNVCRHFDIECTNLEGLMLREQWRY